MRGKIQPTRARNFHSPMSESDGEELSDIDVDLLEDELLEDPEMLKLPDEFEDNDISDPLSEPVIGDNIGAGQDVLGELQNIIEDGYAKQVSRYFQHEIGDDTRKLSIRFLEKDVHDFEVKECDPPNEYVYPSAKMARIPTKPMLFFEVLDDDHFIICTRSSLDGRIEMEKVNRVTFRSMSAQPLCFSSSEEIYSLAVCDGYPTPIVVLLMDGVLDIIEVKPDRFVRKTEGSAVVNQTIRTFGKIAVGNFGCISLFCVCVNNTTFYMGDSLRGATRKFRICQDGSHSKYGKSINDYCFIKDNIIFATERGLWKFNTKEKRIDTFISDITLSPTTCCVFPLDHYFFVTSGTQFLRMYDQRDTEHPCLTLNAYHDIIMMRALKIEKGKNSCYILITVDETEQVWLYRIRNERMVSFPLPVDTSVTDALNIPGLGRLDRGSKNEDEEEELLILTGSGSPTTKLISKLGKKKKISGPRMARPLGSDLFGSSEDDFVFSHMALMKNEKKKKKNLMGDDEEEGEEEEEEEEEDTGFCLYLLKGGEESMYCLPFEFTGDVNEFKKSIIVDEGSGTKRKRKKKKKKKKKKSRKKKKGKKKKKFSKLSVTRIEEEEEVDVEELDMEDDMEEEEEEEEDFDDGYKYEQEIKKSFSLRETRDDILEV